MDEQVFAEPVGTLILVAVLALLRS